MSEVKESISRVCSSDSKTANVGGFAFYDEL